MKVNSYFRACSSKAFYLKERLMHPCLVSSWRAAIACENLSRDELLSLQERKLGLILNHAATNVPFYRRWMEERHVDVMQVKLTDFPVIEKKDIRGHEREFVADGWDRKLLWSRTSGSTGEPFSFARAEYDYTYATLWRGMLRYGIRPGDRRVLVKGVDETASVSRFTRMKRAVYGWINRCIVVDAHYLAKSEGNVEREIRRILAYRPDYIHGYASSIYLLARYAEEHGIDCSVMKLKAVVTESEKCHEFQKEALARVFHAPVVENYGCVEFGMIAQPARDGGMCINDDHVYIETTHDGEAIYTNLDEYGFPLIRFKNGDKIEVGEIHGMLPYRTLSNVEGRVAEAIHLPQGGSLQGYVVMYPVSKHMRFLREYQIYQPDINHLKIRVVETEKLPVEVEKQILREMRDIVGDGINLDIEKVQSIPLTKRGKRTFVCSDVKE